MSHRVFSAAGIVLVLAAPARAQLDPEPRTPYLWQIVLKARPHPLLTGAFRDELKRDIVATLAPALGSLGTVEVVDLAEVPRDKWQPLWQQFDDKGFTALDATRDLTNAKTHFLTLEYQDGQYHLESRQHDGFTGLASPLVRKQNVRAPELVGRTAGLMLDRDFGLTGTVEPGPRDEAKVTLRAGLLGRVDRFVKVGDIFAVSQVKKSNRPAPPPVRTSTGKIVAPPRGSVSPPGLSAQPRSFTLLRVAEVGTDGVIKCTVLTRWKTAMPSKDVAGYRCLKLGTVEEPLVVRLVSHSGALQKSAGQVRVRATEAGFNAPDEPRDYFEFKNGVYRSPRSFANVACVVVSLVGGEAQQYPVPILGTDPVNLQFETSRQAAEAAAFVRAALNLRDRVGDALNAQSICFEATARFIDKQKNEEALARALSGYKSADESAKYIADDLAQLKEQVGQSPEGPRLVAAIEQKLVALRELNAKLHQHIAPLEDVVRREKDPTIGARQVQAEALSERIKLLLGRGDVDEAINAYDQLVTLVTEGDDAAKVRTARDKLKADWKVKSPEHAKARDYLLKTWPAIESIPDFVEGLPRIGAAIDECMKHGDRYTLRKLLSIFTGSIVKLKEKTEMLDENTDQGRKDAASANRVGEAMAALEARIQKFVKGE